MESIKMSLKQSNFCKYLKERKSVVNRFRKNIIQSFCLQCPLLEEKEPEIFCKFIGKKECEIILGNDFKTVIKEKCPYQTEKEIHEWNQEK